MTTPLGPLLTIFDDVTAERWRQLKKWGPQTHPDGTGRALDSEIALMTKAHCEDSFGMGVGTWRDILNEEVTEAYAETEYKALRAELLQVATVALAWVEDLDNRALVPAVKLAANDELIGAAA